MRLAPNHDALQITFYSDQHRATPVDIFVSEPFDFEREYVHALASEIAPGLVVRFVSLPTLIGMKQSAGRPRDLEDIRQLRNILGEDKADG